MSTRYVGSGVTSSGFALGSGFELIVLSGGVAEDIRVRSGGEEIVSAHGSALDTTVYAGGSEQVYGVASGGVLEVSTAAPVAQQTVESGGVASGLLVSGGGQQQVLSGGRAAGTVLVGRTVSGFEDDAELLVSGGRATGVKVGSGGNEVVYASGLTQNVVVSSGGRLSIHPYASATNVVVASAGTVVVWNDDVVSGLGLQKGAIEIHDYEVFVGSSWTGLSVSSGGDVLVDAYGMVSSTTVGSGGELALDGVSYAAVISTGGYELVDGNVGGAIDNGATLIGVVGPGIPNSAMLLGGRALQVLDGFGGANDVIVSSGGWQDVYLGRADRTTVMSGGLAEVDSSIKGVDNNTEAFGFTISSGGELLVYSGGDVTGLLLKAGALVDLGNVTADAASIVSGKLVATWGGVAVESLGLRGVAEFAFSVRSDGDGGTDIAVALAPKGAAATAAASLVQTAAGFNAEKVAAGDRPSHDICNVAPEFADGGVHGRPVRSLA